MRQPIVFVTDFGRDDAYAAALTGAALRVDPHAICVEGTHGISFGDVLAGAYQLKALARAFSGGAVFCAVVDPGVGTERRAIAIKVGSTRCVAPDNGLVSYLWDETPPEDRRAVSIDVARDASPTFHGRDVFAPFAAELVIKGTVRRPRRSDRRPGRPRRRLRGAGGQPRHREGRRGRPLRQRDHHHPRRATSVAQPSVRSPGRVAAPPAWLPPMRTSTPDPSALIGSAGHLEIAGRGTGAVAVGGPRAGDTVEVELA